MTREEAIEILKTDSCKDCTVVAQSPCVCTFDGHCDIREAMQVAIEALEQKQEIVAQVIFDDDKLHELCQRAAEELKEQFVNEGVWKIMGVTLPEVGKDVLICDIDGNIYLTHRVNIDSTKFAFFNEYGDKIKNVVAWMPLPQPYKA